MRLITVSNDFFKLCGDDPELLDKGGTRPHVLVMRLRYKGAKHLFAVPLRSNISPNTPKEQYYALPPRSTTKPRHRHGLHYIKMFPILKQHQRKMRIEGNAFYETLQRILDTNESIIVDQCQRYLDAYADGSHPRYCVDIDAALRKLYGSRPNRK